MSLMPNEALKFATRQASLGATAEATRTMADLSSKGEALPKKKAHTKPTPDQIRGSADGAFRSVGEYAAKGDEGKLTAGLLGAAGNFLPSDISKMIPLAQFALDGSWTKFLSGDKKAIEAAIGALQKILPPELSKLLGKASPLLTKGLESLLGGKDLGDMFSLDGALGLAGQLLPKEYGDALAVAQELYNNFPESMSDLAGSLDSLVGRFLPPELQAAWKALKDAGGLKGLLALFDERPNLQSGTGFWAARITDAVVCPGGAGVIITGLPTVLIGGQPSARVSDKAACSSGSVDSITHGEQTIQIGGQWASRITDQTAHGGTITKGFPTVHLSNKDGQCAGCLNDAASGGATAGSAGAGAGAGGAATISGSGITDAMGGGFMNDLLSGLGEMAKDKIVDFASQKASELVQKALGVKDDETYTDRPMSKKKNDDDDDEDKFILRK